MTVLESRAGDSNGGQSIRLKFSGPVTAGDWTPAWFTDDTDAANATAVTQIAADTLDFGGAGFVGPTGGRAWHLTNQPAGVSAGLSGVALIEMVTATTDIGSAIVTFNCTSLADVSAPSLAAALIRDNNLSQDALAYTSIDSNTATWSTTGFWASDGDVIAWAPSAPPPAPFDPSSTTTIAN